MRNAPKHIDEPLDDVRHVSAICNKRPLRRTLEKQVSSSREWLFLRFLTGPMYAVLENRMKGLPGRSSQVVRGSEMSDYAAKRRYGGTAFACIHERRLDLADCCTSKRAPGHSRGLLLVQQG